MEFGNHPNPVLSFCRFAPRFDALRDFDCRLIRCHAFRPNDFTAEGQTRADIRTRIRSIVIRIRIRHTAIRIRIVVPAIDHTDYWGTLPLAKLLI